MTSLMSGLLLWVQGSLVFAGVLCVTVYAARVNAWDRRMHRVGCAVEQLAGGLGACWVIGWTVGADVLGTVGNALVLAVCAVHVAVTSAHWSEGVPEEESLPMPLDALEALHGQRSRRS